MSSIPQRVKKFVPMPLQGIARSGYYAASRVSQWPEATLHPWRILSIGNLRGYKNSYPGERCFIIGNGPSLNETDLSRLKGEYTFGMNRIYLLFPQLGFNTTFFLSVNDLVIEQCATDILELPIPKFLSWRSRGFIRAALPENGLLPRNPPLSFLFTTYTGLKFAKDVRGRLWEGATVTYVALQLAYHMGFKRVILIGVDHSFTTKGKPNTTVVSQGDDPNHFAGNYFGKGFRWQLPDLETSEKAYRMARKAFEDDGRAILDATVGGRLMIFPKVEFNSLF